MSDITEGFAETWDYGAGEEPFDNEEGRRPGPWPGYHHPGPHFDYPDRMRPPAYPFGWASHPNWMPGYVPSAVEWASWFSRKWDCDDPRLGGAPFLSLRGGHMHGPIFLRHWPKHPAEAVNKAYVDAITPGGMGSFLTHGGDIHGDVNILGHLQVKGDTYLDCALFVRGRARFADDVYMDKNLGVKGCLYIGPTGQTTTNGVCPEEQEDPTKFNDTMWEMCVDPATGNRVTHYDANCYDVVTKDDCTRQWYSDNGLVMQLDDEGNLWIAGTFTPTNMNVPGTLTVGGLTQLNGGLNVVGDEHVSGEVYAASLHASGDMSAGGNTALNTLSTNGNASFGNDIYVAGEVYAASAHISGDLSAGGTTTLNNLNVNGSENVAGNLTVNGFLRVNGGAELDPYVGISGNLDMEGHNINNVGTINAQRVNAASWGGLPDGGGGGGGGGAFAAGLATMGANMADPYNYGKATITFTTPFASPPAVLLQHFPVTVDAGSVIVVNSVASNITTTGFEIFCSNAANIPEPGAQVYWIAAGMTQ